MEDETYGYTRYYNTQAIVKYEIDDLKQNRLETYVEVKDHKIYIKKILNGETISEDEIFNLG